MKTIRTLLTAAALAVLPAAAFGHGAEVGPNGGMQTHAGPHHQELVVKGGELTVYMYTMKDEPIPTEGAEGTATVLVAGKPEQVKLAPAGGNALKGTVATEPGKGARVVTSVTLKGKAPVQARYEVK